MKIGTVLFSMVGMIFLGGALSSYNVAQKVPLPGTGGWDYLTVDESARRVYVSHATQVVVLDADSLKVVGTISGMTGVHGIALAPDFNEGFITSGQTDSVVVFDPKSLQKVAEIKVGKKPDAIVYDPSTKKIFAMNGDSDSTSVIDPAENKVVGTIALGGGPEFPAADGKGNVFVNIEEKNEVVRIDAKGQKVRDHWNLAPCQAPASMGFDAAASRLFIGCRNKLMAVVDSESGKVVATFPIGEKADATVFDVSGKTAFTSTGDGHIYGFQQKSADSYNPLPVIDTAAGSKTMTIDQKTRLLLVPAKDSNGGVSLWVLRP